MDPEQMQDVALPDFAYEGGLRPGVDLYDKDAMAELLADQRVRVLDPTTE